MRRRRRSARKGRVMAVFEFPMVFPADGVSLVGRVYRNVDDLATPQPAVVVTGSWLTVKEQMPRTYALRLAEHGITAFTFDFTGFGQSGCAPVGAASEEDRRHRRGGRLSVLQSLRPGGGVGHGGICASAPY